MPETMSDPRAHAAPAVVLVRPQEDGNIGAAARAMANFGLSRLVLVAPEVRLGAMARAMAVGAHAILDAAVVLPSLTEALAPFRRIVGTTSSRGREQLAGDLTARALPARLATDPAGTSTALVFGPERSGLTSDELALCSPIVSIPCAPTQPTLNLAQAVLIVAYELWTAGGGSATRSAGEPPSTQAELEGLFAQLDALLRGVGFARDTTYLAVARDLRHLLARAAPTTRETRIVRGILRRTRRALGGASVRLPQR